MKRFLITLVLVLGVLAAAVAGTAYWAGMEAEKHFHAFLTHQEALNPNMKLSEISYQRGWFSSRAATKLTFKNMPRELASDDMAITLKHDIYHGVLPVTWWAQGGFSPRPVQAVIRTELGRDNLLMRQVAAFFGQGPLSVVSSIALDGSSVHDVNVQPLNLSNQAGLTNLAFTGLQGQLRAAPHGATLQGELQTTALLIEGLEAPDSAVRARDFKVTVDQRKGQVGLMLGDSNLHLTEFEVRNMPGGPKQSLLFSGLTVLTNAQEHAGQTDLLDSSLKFSVDKVSVDGAQAGKGALNLVLSKLDGPTVVQLQRWTERQGTAPDASAVTEVLGLLQTLLKRNPELALNTQVNTRQGDLTATAQFIFQNPRQLDLQDQRTLLQLLAGAKADITVAKPLLEQAFTSLLKSRMLAAAAEQGQQAPDEETLNTFADSQVKQQLAQLVASQMIREEGNTYRTQARIEQGRLFVNDTEIPL